MNSWPEATAMTICKLSTAEIGERLTALPLWTLMDGKLHRELTFSSFVQAFGFMTQVALLAERQNHHPEWSNLYHRVVVNLTTHECQGISERDFSLAREIDALCRTA